MGPGGYRYSTLPAPTRYHYPGYTPPLPPLPGTLLQWCLTEVNMVVGLISVGQLTCGPLFSGFQGMTEGYNVRITGRINNHSLITGNE